MKITLLLITFVFVSFLHVSAQQHAVTDSGRSVTLNPDGTWVYDMTTENNPATETTDGSDDATLKKFTKPALSKALLKSKRNSTALWYDAAIWRKGNAVSDAAEFTLSASNSMGFCNVITEAIELSYSMLKDAVIQNAQEMTPDFKILAEEYRMVNGQKILYLKARAAKDKVVFFFTYYVYTGKAGTTQLICYTSENLAPKMEKTFENLLNGFTVIK